MDGVATFVGICDTDDNAPPQDGQKLAPAGALAEQEGQRVVVSAID
jgi:hypothetical protein